MHATTLITNALIEGKIGRSGLVTTKGFGDTLLIRDEHRYDMYDLQIEFPAPPIPRELTFEIDERVERRRRGARRPAPTATSTRSPRQLRAARTSSRSRSACSTATSIGRNEQQGRRLTCARELGVPVCISAEISPQIREYPRMITTACNAATMPVIGPYLDELQKWLSAEGFGGSVLMMLSNGGVVSADDAARAPIRLVESGPAAGALAGSWFAKRLGEDRLLCFDMGGTTAKACLIEHGEPELTNTFEVARAYRFKKGSGFPVSVPSVDLVEIGAGGGSLGRVDQFGLLKVGPESRAPSPARPATAAAAPSRRSPTPTWCSACSTPTRSSAATCRSTASLADGAVASGSPTQLGLSTIDTAAGMHEIVNQNMAAAARMHGVEMGVDLRGVTVIAFGGAGPVHACGVADLLESDRRDLPRQRQRAVGVRHARVAGPHRSRPVAAAHDRHDRSGRARRAARRAAHRGSPGAVGGRRARRRGAVPLRHRRPLLPGRATRSRSGSARARPGRHRPARSPQAFDAEYRRIYGLTIPDVPIEAVTWRLSASAITTVVEPSTTLARRRRATAHRSLTGRWSSAVGAPPSTRRCTDGADLGAGARFDGPAVVEERETTSVIRPGWSVEVAADGSLIATRAGATREP